MKVGHLAALRAMRDKLASSMDAADHAVIAQVAARLQAVLAEIAAIESQSPEVSDSDDIARDLAAGLADAKVVQLAGRGRNRGSG